MRSAVSPSGSITMPEVAPGACARDRPIARRPGSTGRPARPRPTRCSRTGSPRAPRRRAWRARGHHDRHRAVRVVEHDLERRARAGARRRRSRSSAGGVELERPGREHDVADVAGERAAEVLAVEQPLDLALRRLVDVAPVGVEEADLDACRDRPAASRTVIPPCGRLLRTWNRVSGTVASSTSSTLTPARLSPPMIARFSARAIRLVSRLVVTTDALLQRGAVGHREADRDLGRDVDVGEPARRRAGRTACARRGSPTRSTR